jgi:hypothetical protein
MLELLLIIVLLLIVAVIMYLLFSKYKKPSTKRKVTKEQIVPKTELELNIGLLLALNIKIREASLPQNIVVAIESTIDSLRELLPEILARHEKTEMAWVMKKMCSSYLPKLINPFVGLSDPKEQSETFLTSLAGIDAELAEVKSLLNSVDESEFESKARFIKHRFGGK